MNTGSDGWVPTTQLRFVVRAAGKKMPERRVLQQWWAPDVPAYMRSQAVGEWRDVPEVAGE